MTATGLLILLIIGAIAGWLLPLLGVGFSVGNPIITSILYALIGAIVLLVIIGLFRRAPRV
jgi:uncharacterized membrane protein YeaQ/YmgE (transglycosylase-associated protein family)